jgi:hypothetical protein
MPQYHLGWKYTTSMESNILWDVQFDCDNTKAIADKNLKKHREGSPVLVL